MVAGMSDELVTELFVILIIGCGFPLLATACVSLTVGVLQAATQVQEQTTLFLVRISTLLAALWFIAPWLAARLLHFFGDIIHGVGLDAS
jgi:flagellar biosynthesis protein FliQ